MLLACLIPCVHSSGFGMDAQQSGTPVQSSSFLASMCCLWPTSSAASHPITFGINQLIIKVAYLTSIGLSLILFYFHVPPCVAAQVLFSYVLCFFFSMAFALKLCKTLPKPVLTLTSPHPLTCPSCAALPKCKCAYTQPHLI